MTEQDTPPPNPGSDEAIKFGCKCARMDNHYGKGIETADGPLFWYSSNCPLHGHHVEPEPPPIGAIPDILNIERYRERVEILSRIMDELWNMGNDEANQEISLELISTSNAIARVWGYYRVKLIPSVNDKSGEKQ